MIKKYIAKRQRTTPTGTDLGKATPKSPDWASILHSPDYQPSIFMTLPSKAFLNLRRCHTTWRDLSWRSMFERFVNPPLSNTSTDITQLKDEFRLLQFLNKIHRHNQPLLKNGFDNLKKDTRYTACAQAYTILRQNTDSLSPKQEKNLTTLYSSLKIPYQTQQQLTMKAIDLIQDKHIELDPLNTHIQNYININLQKEKEALFGKLEEKPEDNDAAKTKHTRTIIHWISEHPILVFATDEDGWTPLHWAAYDEHTEVVKLLIANRADVDAKNKWGHTPLHLAAFWGKTDVSKLLLEAGTEVNTTVTDGTFKGYTPLHVAAYHEHTKVIKVLLQAGADPTVTDSNGQTPLDLAEDFGNTDTAELLREARART